MSYEQSIKEARTIEAMRNGYMGLGGKFCQITKKFGYPVISQSGLYLDETKFEDIFQENETEIQTMDHDQSTYEVGWQFDGLSRGMNISIMVLNHLREITVTYQGSVVYKEISGELESYCPNKVWEDWINKLYEVLKKIQRKESPERNRQQEEQKEEKKSQIIDYLKKKWGDIV